MSSRTLIDELVDKKLQQRIQEHIDLAQKILEQLSIGDKSNLLNLRKSSDEIQALTNWDTYNTPLNKEALSRLLS